MRAVLDPNIRISALLSPAGAPARVVTAWREGGFELIASPLLLDELGRALSYPKLRKRITAEESAAVIAWISRESTIAGDGESPPARSSDPGADDLIALAESQRAALVSGDSDLLALKEALPIFTAAGFLDWLAAHADAA